MEDPALLANRPVEKLEEKVERDSRALVKRLLTFTLTEQVFVLVYCFLWAPQQFLVNEND